MLDDVLSQCLFALRYGRVGNAFLPCRRAAEGAEVCLLLAVRLERITVQQHDVLTIGLQTGHFRQERHACALGKICPQ